jgi:hypothetical protein
VIITLGGAVTAFFLKIHQLRQQSDQRASSAGQEDADCEIVISIM